MISFLCFFFKESRVLIRLFSFKKEALRLGPGLSMFHWRQQAQSGEGDSVVCQSTSRLCLLNRSVRLRTEVLGFRTGSSWMWNDWMPYWLVMATAAEDDLRESIEWIPSTAWAWHDFASSTMPVWMVCIDVRVSSMAGCDFRCSHWCKFSLMASTVNEKPTERHQDEWYVLTKQQPTRFHFYIPKKEKDENTWDNAIHHFE